MAHKRQQAFLVILLIILAAVVSIVYMVTINKKTEVRTGPQFTKEGELWIVPGDSTDVDAAKVQIDIEIADNDLDIRQGLMYRQYMEPQQGMLFFMPQEEEQSFWMLNTYISLDILFAKADGTIVHIARNTPPHGLNPIPSRYPAKYVLEVNAGFCRTHGVATGDKLVWEKLR